jgi:hypothetical protein
VRAAEGFELPPGRPPGEGNESHFLGDNEGEKRVRHQVGKMGGIPSYLINKMESVITHSFFLYYNFLSKYLFGPEVSYMANIYVYLNKNYHGI